MKYGKEITKKLCRHLKQGSSIKSACHLVGLGTSTFYEWMKDKPDFSDTIKRAMAVPDKAVVNALYKSAIMGHSYVEREFKAISNKEGTEIIEIPVKAVKKFIPPNVTAQIFWLKNRCPEEFKDRAEIEHFGEVSIVISDKFLPKDKDEDGAKS